jgi:hypothetical protein
MQYCKHCGSENFYKSGHRYGKQNYRCKDCGKQFLEVTEKKPAGRKPLPPRPCKKCGKLVASPQRLTIGLCTSCYCKLKKLERSLARQSKDKKD